MNEAGADPGVRRVRLLKWLAAFGLIVTLVAGFMVPIYTDETGWRFQERAGIDGGVDIMFNDLCGPNTIARVPWFMMPARWFSAVTNQALADPLFLRLEGIACAMAWLALLCLLTRRLEANETRRHRIQTLAFVLLGLGTLPFLLIMSRPEQPLMLSLTLIMLVVFARAPAIGERMLAWLKVTAIVMLASVAASYHMKGVVYSPVVLAALAVCAKGRGTVLPRLAGSGVLIALTLGALHYWVERFQCLGDPKMAALLAKENISAIIASGGSAGDVLFQMVQGLNPFNYVSLATPSNDPMSQWLPAGLFPEPMIIAVAVALNAVWLVTLACAAYVLVQFLKANGVRALGKPRVLLALAILACVLVWGMSQINRNVYEIAHVLPMLVVFTILCLTLPAPEPSRTHQFVARLLPFAVPAALTSEILLLAFTSGPLLNTLRSPGYIDTQPYSVSIRDYASIRRDIDKAMAGAGMPTGRRLVRPLVDDGTYLALQGSLLPLHRLGVLETWNPSIDDPVVYLRSRGSDGVVVNCERLPPTMRASASRSGEICAISGASLERLAESARASHTVSKVAN